MRRPPVLPALRPELELSPRPEPAPLSQVRTAEDLGALVRTKRRGAGQDQVTAAGLAGVGPRFLGELERGKSTIRLGLALQVLERLGLEVWVAPRRTPGRGR